MVLKRAYVNLHQQLLVNVKASTKKQNAQELQKKIALLKYQKTNALRSNEVSKIAQIDNELKEIEKSVQDPEVQLDSGLIEGLKLSENSEHSARHVEDVANFLSYQRTYQELIERYNPGLRMTQEDKIRKTANRVGFELPEDFNKQS